MLKAASMAIMIVIMMSGCEEKYTNGDCHSPKLISYKELRSEYPKIKAGQKIVKAAKIYNYQNGDILLINERNKGIHVVNNRIKSKVTKGDYFIEIPGNVDMAVKDGYLYADSFTDLVVIDILDMGNMKTVARKEGIFLEDFYQAVHDDKTDKRCSYSGNDFVIGYN